MGDKNILPIDDIRNVFDTLFLGQVLSDKEKELLAAMGIDSFADIYMNAKKYGYAASQKVLADLVKVSFSVYGNLDTLPIQRKVLLPTQDGKYKFIIAGANGMQKMLQTEKPEVDILENNTIALVSTGDDAHAKIASKCGIWGNLMQLYVFGGARIDIDRKNKTIKVFADSGSYWSCSNQIVERLLEEYIRDGYKVTINMDHQKEFFTEDDL